MRRKNRFAILGRFGGSVGLQGHLKIQSFTTHGKDIFRYSPWVVCNEEGQAQQGLQITFTFVREISPSVFVVALPNIIQPEQTKVYTNKYIGVSELLFPPLPAQEHYWHNLIGCAVWYTNKCYGQVSSLLHLPGSDILVVKKKNTKDKLIPFIQGKYIAAVDTQKNRIFVNWEPDW